MTKKSRRILTTLLAMALAVSMTACGEKPVGADTAAPPEQTETPPEKAPEKAPEAKPETEKPAEEALEGAEAPVGDNGLDALRLEMEPSAAIGGIFFMGCTDQKAFTEEFFAEMNQENLKDYPLIKDAAYQENLAKNDGREFYFVVPADPDAKVKVEKWDADTNSIGEVIYESESGEPFWIQGNVSDIMPNTAVTITNGYGETLEQYLPSISLADGTLSLPNDDQPLMLDMTRYNFEVPYDDPQEVADQETLKMQALTLTRQIAMFTLNAPDFLEEPIPYPDASYMERFLVSVPVMAEDPDYPYADTYRIETDGTCYFPKANVEKILAEVFKVDTFEPQIMTYNKDTQEYSYMTGFGIGNNMECKELQTEILENELVVSYELWTSSMYPDSHYEGSYQTKFTFGDKEDGGKYLLYLETVSTAVG